MRRTAAVVVAVLLLAGCGRGSGDRTGTSSGGLAKSAVDAPGSDGMAPARAANGPAAVGDAVPLSRSIVRTATLTVRVGDVNAARGSAVTAAERTGGYLESERSSLESGTTLTLRVPPDAFTGALDAVARLGTVATREVTTDDVTGDVADVEGRLAAARASTTRLRGLLDKATSITEIAALESELTDRESDLESLATRQRSLVERTALATITATFVRRAPVVAAPKPGAAGFSGGLDAGWHAFTAVVAVLLVVTGAVLPFAVVLVVGGVPLYVRLRRRRVGAPA